MKPTLLFLAASACAAAPSPDIAASREQASSVAPEPKGRYVLFPFDYRGVRLDEGPLAAQVREVRESYLRVSDDSYLKGFRRRAGFPAPGDELGGWYGRDHFHVFGQVVSGLARLFAATGDPVFKQRVDSLVAGWARCIEPDGFFFYSRDPNSPHYIYEKMVYGLVDAHLYARTPGALDHLDRITTWAEKNLDRSRVFAHVSPGRSQEWYTLSENLYRAYLATGQQRYREFARIWEYPEYWDTFRLNQDILKRPGRYHAYSHVNTFAGAAMAYRVTGETGYLDTILRAYDFLRDHQNFATGGYGPGEGLLPARELIEFLDGDDRSFETQCGSWAGFKLAKYLMAFTGDARFGDWIESLLINAMSASLPMSRDGQVTYYVNYALGGGHKRHTVGPWPCCAGTRIQAVADYADLIFFRSDDALHVNLFTPSTVEWSVAGTSVRIRQSTRFPEENSTRFTIDTPKDATFTLRLRNPAWLAGPMKLRVNGGDASQPAPDDQHWVAIRRIWRKGDIVEVEFPMALALRRFPAVSEKPFPAAVSYGPTVLAFESRDGPPGRFLDLNNIGVALAPVPGPALTFRAAGRPDLVARPLYAYAAGENYYVYLDPSYTWTQVPRDALRRTGPWRDAGLLTSTEPGAALELDFEATGVRWVGQKFDDAGRARLSIDGREVATIDQYDPRRGRPFRHSVTGLAPGRHSLRIEVLLDRNPKSSNRYINVARIEVLSGQPERRNQRQ